MALMPRLKENFCFFIAIVNFVAFNFGFHVHEKAMLMVYIPLLMGAATDRDKTRVKMLGTVMMWTLLPLIPGQIESAVKHCLFLLQLVIYHTCFTIKHTPWWCQMFYRAIVAAIIAT